MKAVFIVYNQAHTEKVEYLLDRLEIRGYSKWPGMTGRGTETGDPHMGTHTWPEVNSGVLTVIEDHQVEAVLDSIRKLDVINTEVGIRAFVWEVLQTV